MDILQEIDIIPADRVVFLHIPKTAGLTFNLLIDSHFAYLHRCEVMHIRNLLRLDPEIISTHHFFSGHFTYRVMSQLIPDEFIALSFLREPYSRTISHYDYLLRQESLGGSPHIEAELQVVKKMSIDEFVRNPDLRLSRQIINTQTTFLGGFDKKYPDRERKYHSSTIEKPDPNEYITPTSKNLDIAIRRLREMAFFGLTERFQESLFLLCFLFGWPPIINEIQLNQSPRSKEKDNISAKTQAEIKKRIKLDSKLYSFAKKLFEQRYKAMEKELWNRFGDHGKLSYNEQLPIELITRLLEANYQFRREKRNRAVMANIGPSYHFDPSQYVEGPFGWHILEFSNMHGPMRWSGPGRHSGFDLPRPVGKKIQITFRVLMALHPNIIENLELTANQLPVVLEKSIDVDGSHLFKGMIPEEALITEFIHFVFSAPETIMPCSLDANNPDTRSLGFLFNWMTLQAL